MKIIIANDHRGYNLKRKIVKYLNKKGYEYIDLGSDSTISVDYPEFAFKLGEMVREDKENLGIAICGTGIGISIACNKVKGIRCAKVNNAKETKLAKIDNDANIIALSGKTSLLRTLDIIDTFILTKHVESDRHERRIRLISNYENEKTKKIIGEKPKNVVEEKIITIEEPVKKAKEDIKKEAKTEKKETVKKEEKPKKEAKAEKKETVKKEEKPKKEAKAEKKETVKKEVKPKKEAKAKKKETVKKEEKPKKETKVDKKEKTK